MAAIVGIVAYVAWPNSAKSPPQTPVTTAPAVVHLPPAAAAHAIEDGKRAAEAKARADQQAQDAEKGELAKLTQKKLIMMNAQQATLALRASMRDPDSFRLVEALRMDSGVVCFEYRGRNGFGGMALEHALLDKRGMHGPGERGYPSGWNAQCANKSGVSILSDLDATLEMAGPQR